LRETCVTRTAILNCMLDNWIMMMGNKPNTVVLDSVKSIDLRKYSKEHFDSMKGEHFFWPSEHFPDTQGRPCHSDSAE